MNGNVKIKRIYFEDFFDWVRNKPKKIKGRMGRRVERVFEFLLNFVLIRFILLFSSISTERSKKVASNWFHDPSAGLPVVGLNIPNPATVFFLNRNVLIPEMMTSLDQFSAA